MGSLRRPVRRRVAYCSGLIREVPIIFTPGGAHPAKTASSDPKECGTPFIKKGSGLTAREVAGATARLRETPQGSRIQRVPEAIAL